MGLEEIKEKISNGDIRQDHIRRLRAQLDRLETDSHEEVKEVLKYVAKWAQEIDPEYGDEIMDCLQYHLGVFQEPYDGEW